WAYGGADDRTINTSAEIDAVRAALAQSVPGSDGYADQSSAVWRGLHQRDREIIYPISASLGGTDLQITTPDEIRQAREALGSTGYANHEALANIAPDERPGIFPTSWNYG